MGFNIFGYGNICPVSLSTNEVSYVDCAGTKHTYHTSLEADVKQQLNIFHSNDVLFYLEDDAKVYMGRTDGVISVYRKRDMLLIALQHWEVPVQPGVEPAGYKRFDTIIYPIYIDRSDSRSLYCTYRRACAALSKPYTGKFLTSQFTLEALSMSKPHLNEFTVFTEGGELLETNEWTIQESLWRRDCKVFL